MVAGLVFVASVAGVSVVRPKLAETLNGTKEAEEIYTLPPPEALPVVSLGYRSALADVLFTKAIIAHAQHAERKQRYDAVADYLEAIIALDPNLVAPQGITPEAMALTYGHPHDESGHSGGEQEGPRQASKETERNG